MLESRGLKFAYKGGPSFNFPDVRCDAKEHLLLLGESGTGKTTLLHLLAGLLRPAPPSRSASAGSPAGWGSIEIQGTDITRLSEKALDKFRGQHIGIVFQSAHFVQSLNVADNLALPQYLSGRPQNKEKSKLLLERMNLGGKLNARPRELSVGEQQRVAIARALVNDPSILLADEPTSALDDKNAEEVIQLLEEQALLTGASLIIVTHDQRLKDRFEKRVSL